tara:strand:- start:971 stop:1396 length:426 start_codon:yes stop_codon:yes gene_type:complete
MSIKHSILEYLNNNIYCKLKPSKIHGVGVFAIKNIPKNTNPFKEFGKNVKLIIPKSELNGMDENIKKLLSDFMVNSEDKQMILLSSTFQSHYKYYLNTGDEPNLTYISSDTCNTIRDIDMNEELILNYEKEYSNLIKSWEN